MPAMVIRVILACPRHVRLEGNLGIAGCPVCLVDALCLRFCRASRFSAMRGWRGAEKEDRGGRRDDDELGSPTLLYRVCHLRYSPSLAMILLFRGMAANKVTAVHLGLPR
jgi:hypothetical protein